MYILDLAVADGLDPKKVASTNGGEYHSPCPGCGGKDRFIIWNKQNRYYCRRCQKRGDPIQYLRDFHAMSYVEACKLLNLSPKTPPHTQLWKPQPSFTPHTSNLPELAWRQHASNFITICHKRLLATSNALELLYDRGFTLGTMQHFQLGWNPQTFHLNTPSNKKIWLPKGIVIPTFDAQLEPLKLKIRQQDAHPKYIEISGSQKAPSIYGDPTNKPFLILESELDAML
ncbi:MAG: hypothetical protein JSR46_11645, partial [Verrucomicrobia bacterium]|nr:hypothetical protein [Verrucomicrobiota bacterium]